MHATDPTPDTAAPTPAPAAADDPYAVTEAVTTGRAVAADPVDALIAHQRWLRIAIVAAPVAWVLAWSINWSALLQSPAWSVFIAPWLVPLAAYVLVAVRASARVAWLTGLERWAGIGFASLSLVPLLGVATMAWLHVRANRALERQGFTTRWHGPLF